jgi:predicted Zn-dependent protease
MLCTVCVIILVSCSSKDVDYNTLKKRYDKVFLDYFSDVGFHNHNILIKWDKNITVSFNGDFDENDLKSVNEFISVFNREVKTVKMELIQNPKADIVIFIEDSPRLKGYTGLSYTNCRPLSFNNIIYQSRVYVAPSPIISSNKRYKTIQHELLHAIGLHHSPREFKSHNTLGKFTFKNIDEYEQWSAEYKIPPLLDRMAIKILYDKMIPAGLKREVFLKGLNKTNM